MDIFLFLSTSLPHGVATPTSEKNHINKEITRFILNDSQEKNFLQYFIFIFTDFFCFVFVGATIPQRQSTTHN